MSALEGAAPEGAVLSNDLGTGVYARTGLVSDVELLDEYPSNVLTHTHRQHRWIRDDWQILSWLSAFVPSPRGVTRHALPLIARWKIVDTLRRSLIAPALLALFVAGWTVLPGSPWFWNVVVVGVAASQLLPVLVLVGCGMG